MVGENVSKEGRNYVIYFYNTEDARSKQDPSGERKVVVVTRDSSTPYIRSYVRRVKACLRKERSKKTSVWPRKSPFLGVTGVSFLLSTFNICLL